MIIPTKIQQLSLAICTCTLISYKYRLKGKYRLAKYIDKIEQQLQDKIDNFNYSAYYYNADGDIIARKLGV